LNSSNSPQPRKQGALCFFAGTGKVMMVRYCAVHAAQTIMAEASENPIMQHEYNHICAEDVKAKAQDSSTTAYPAFIKESCLTECQQHIVSFNALERNSRQGNISIYINKINEAAQ
jgi:hypothetical protein